MNDEKYIEMETSTGEKYVVDTSGVRRVARALVLIFVTLIVLTAILYKIALVRQEKTSGQEGKGASAVVATVEQQK